jgi:amino acid adenylation domain-containing protein
MQTGMLLFSAGAERPLYVMQMSCRLPYQIDITVFTQAWQWAVDRHEALRTGFIWSDVDEPLQEVHQAAQITVRLESIESLSPAEQSAWLTDFADRDLNQPFDLGSPPLIRVALIRLAEADFFLLFTAHHCVFDGRSRQIVIDEVFRYYDGLRVGIKAEFPPAPRYETFVSWVLAQEFVDAKEYWQNLLKSCDSSSVLQNFLRSGPVSLPDSIQNYVLPISREMSDRCHSCAKQLQVTVNTIVQACWALLLHRWSSQANITFGNTRACRRVPVEGAQSMVGLLINSLPCFVHLGSTTKVIEVLEDLRAQHLTVRPYEATPLQLIRQWTGLGEHLCDTSVVFESWHPNYLPGLAASGSRPIEVTRRANSHYRLMLFGYGQPSLTLEIEYDACWIHPFTIEQIARHYITLMDAVISDPNITVAEIRMLTDEERNQVLNWGRRQSNNLRGNVPEWFKEEAGRRWDAVAVEYGEEQLSYAELNRRSNQLARYLRKRGVGAEVLVGICLERSLEMVIAVLGILKAGGGYVALDPDYPRERLRYMMEDAGIRVVLSGKSFEGLMPERGMEVISLEREGKVWQEAGEEEGSDVAVWVDGENLAYVSYTSGSTGKPKGVGIPHRAIVRLVKGADYVDLHEGDVWLQLAPVVFDASTFEIWGSLLNGGRLVVYEAGIPTLEGIGRVLREKQVTVLWLTAGLFQQMVEQERESLRGVRELLAGGDVLGVEAVRRALGAGCEVINGYGPTENTTFTCCYRVPREGWPGTTVPIGAPINCTEVYVLDEYLEPVPVGVVGELYMGGRGLARGYQGRAELTAEKFIPNRFSREGGERLYRSGDRVRWLGEGVLEFCGRRDDQVKVRGFRIELREIEAVLQELEEVEQAVVTVREDTAAGKQLVAYVVPRQGVNSLRPGQVKDYLRVQLPDYMRPAFVKCLEQVPLNPNGKVDRHALLQLSLEGEERPSSYHEPETAAEKVIAKIWAEILNARQVGRFDNFFELGGDSLLAVRMNAKAKKLLRATVTVQDLLRAPVLESFTRNLIANEERPGLTEKIAAILLNTQPVVASEEYA